MAEKISYDTEDLGPKPVVLVTGAAGLVGSYLCEFLLLKNCRVAAVDDLTVGQKENLKNCSTNPNFTFLKDNLRPVGRLDYIFCLSPFASRDVEKFLKLAKENGTKLLLVDQAMTQRYPPGLNEVSRYKETVDFRFVRLGFVYGPRMNLRAGGDEVSFLIKAAMKGEPLKISGSGSKKIYPTFVSDVVYGLSKAMFSSGTGGKIFSLINPQGISLFDFAQLLKEENPLSSQIEFMPEEKEEWAFIPDEAFKSQAELNWEVRVGVREGIKQTLAFFDKALKSRPAFFPVTRAQPVSRPVAPSDRRPRITKKRKAVVVGFLLTLFLLASPFALLAFNGFLGVSNIKGAQKALLEADFSQATRKARAAQKNLSWSNQKIQGLVFLFDFFGFGQIAQRTEKLFTVGSGVAEGLVHAGLAIQSATQLGKVIFQDQPGEMTNLLSEIKAELDSAYNQLSFAEAEVKTEKDLLPVEIPFQETRNLLLKVREGVEILPEITGIGERRVYLVLLQNNMELRPTGGFLGSYALVTFQDGRLIDFTVEDVYAADGQLKGHVEPPEEIKEYLGEAGWYLRDSNWHPDFPTSALRAEWFLEKEIGRTVDGVVGIDLFLAQHILEQIGEIELIDFQEKINHQNLFERAEYYSEAGFFPGSTQKKDFLASLARALFERIKTSEEKTWLSLARALYTSLKEKDLLIYLHDPQAMKVVTNLDWDGRIKEIACQSSVGTCYLDYLMIVEANVGVNKANYFVQRSLNHQVEIKATGGVEEKLEIHYQNQSQSENFPAGRYKNYLRLLVPHEAKLKEVLIDGKELEGEKIDEGEINGKKSFGFLVEVPIKGEKKVEVAYRLGEKIDFRQTNQYLFFLQKQPGIKDKAFNLWLTAPEGVSLIEPQPTASQNLHTLLFNPEFNQDIVFEVGMIK